MTVVKDEPQGGSHEKPPREPMSHRAAHCAIFRKYRISPSFGPHEGERAGEDDAGGQDPDHASLREKGRRTKDQNGGSRPLCRCVHGGRGKVKGKQARGPVLVSFLAKRTQFPAHSTGPGPVAPTFFGLGPKGRRRKKIAPKKIRTMCDTHHRHATNLGLGCLLWRASNEELPMRPRSASVSTAPSLSAALSSAPAPPPAVRRLWPLALIGLGLTLTLAWSCLLGYGLVTLFGFAVSQVEWSLLALF